MQFRAVVVVGNGMAGARTLEELLKLAPDLYDITVFGAEPYPNYNRILLSPVLSGEQTKNGVSRLAGEGRVIVEEQPDDIAGSVKTFYRLM